MQRTKYATAPKSLWLRRCAIDEANSDVSLDRRVTTYCSSVDGGFTAAWNVEVLTEFIGEQLVDGGSFSFDDLGADTVIYFNISSGHCIIIRLGTARWTLSCICLVCLQCIERGQCDLRFWRMMDMEHSLHLWCNCLVHQRLSCGYALLPLLRDDHRAQAVRAYASWSLLLLSLEIHSSILVCFSSLYIYRHNGAVSLGGASNLGFKGVSPGRITITYKPITFWCMTTNY